MNNLLIYLPLEPYAERYTALMSCKNGWTEQHFFANQINFLRIDGEGGSGVITSGSVVDAFGRSLWAMSQIAQTIKLIQDGLVDDKTVIYTEDFWHPGIDSLFYIRAITGINFKIGCFLHAQSVDETDFTHKMKEWIRPIEIGLSKGYDYIFVCSRILKHLCWSAGYRADNLHVVGLPYNSERLLEQQRRKGALRPIVKDEKSVIFSSRFDSEKNPHFFLDLVERCPDIDFRLVNPRAGIPISDDPRAVKRAQELTSKNLTIINTANKADYYDALEAAKVQFNCAKQDWVSWTLLEGITFQCLPLYPNWKDFPQELKEFPESLYNNEDLEDAETKLRSLLEQDFREDYYLVTDKHNDSWRRYLKTMELI